MSTVYPGWITRKNVKVPVSLIFYKQKSSGRTGYMTGYTAVRAQCSDPTPMRMAMGGWGGQSGRIHTLPQSSIPQSTNKDRLQTSRDFTFQKNETAQWITTGRDI